MRRLWNRRGRAVKKWRSRAWSIDLRKTKLTIVKAYAPDLADSAETLEITDLYPDEPLSIPRLHTIKSRQLAELYNLDADALTPIEEEHDLPKPNS